MSKQKILYGAGAMGKRAYLHYTKSDPNAVAYFADTYKGGTEYLGIPVLSLDEFLKIYKNYDVVLCIFDLREAAYTFKKQGVNLYSIYSDMVSADVKEMLPRAYPIMKENEPTDTRLKILYGAGTGGALAFLFYGEDNVYAFADQNKAGDEYYGKPVLALAKLKALQESYDIVVCIDNYDSAASSLKAAGVERFRQCFGKGFDNIALQTAFEIDRLYAEAEIHKLIDEVRVLDFIQYPKYINTYKEVTVASTRRSRHKNSETKIAVSRRLRENILYGLFEELCDFAGCNNTLYSSPAIAHGVWAHEGDPVRLHFQNLIEMGDLAKSSIHQESMSCLCFVVGAYTYYAKSFYDCQTFENYKNSLGRNLLVFPAHSVYDNTVLYDEREFVNFALEEAKAFDSITISAHHHDYNKDIIKLFRACGANIVSSGFQWDPSFIQRLKTIISASDAVLTNGFGTHIFYCLALGKPVKYFSQELDFDTLDDKKFYLDRAHNRNAIKLLQALSTKEYNITPNQMMLCEPYGGFTHFKTKEEMAAIFNLSRRIVEDCDYKISRYIDSMRYIYNELKESRNPEEMLQFSLMKEALPPNYETYRQN